MMDFNERVIPGVSANFLLREAEARYLFALRHIPKGSEVLDVGCGTGYGSAILARKSRVTGIDIDLEAVAYAKRHYSRKGLFKRGDVLKLGPGPKFDAVCAFEIIEHLGPADKFLGKIGQVLKKRGVVVLSTPNKTKVLVPSPYHVREYSLSQFEKLLQKNFAEVRIFGQTRSKRAEAALAEFLKSQKARQTLVDADSLGLRKIIPRPLKEKVWRWLGSFFGRGSQESLKAQDFPITQRKVAESNYFVAVCKK